MTGQRDSSLFIWDLKEENFISNLVGHNDKITSLETHNKSNLLFSGSWDTKINIYDLNNI